MSLQGSKRGIFMKNTPNNNFLTVQPISTNNMLIDSDQQVEKAESFESSQI
jgi:hypothetical protein